MEECEHKNTLQLTRGFSHTFGNTTHNITKAWRARKFNLIRLRPIVFKCSNWGTKIASLRDWKKLAGTQVGLDEGRTPTQHEIFSPKKWGKIKYFLKTGKIVKIVRGEIVVFEDGPKYWSCKITHKLD